MNRLQSVIKNYRRRLRAMRTGGSVQEVELCDAPGSFMTARTRREIEQLVSVQIRRRLIKKAMEEE
jgi:hypothetical protein